MFANGVIDFQGPARQKPKNDTLKPTSSTEPAKRTRSKSKQPPSKSPQKALETDSSDNAPLQQVKKRKKATFTIVSDDEQAAPSGKVSDIGDKSTMPVKIKQEKGQATSSAMPVDPPAAHPATASSTTSIAQPVNTAKPTKAAVRDKAAPTPATQKPAPRPIKKPTTQVTIDPTTASKPTTFSGSLEAAESLLSPWKGERSLLPISAEKIAGKISLATQKASSKAYPEEIPATALDSESHPGPLKAGFDQNTLPSDDIIENSAHAAKHQGESSRKPADFSANASVVKKPSAFGPQRPPGSIPNAQHASEALTSNVKRGANDEDADAVSASKKIRMNSGMASRVPSAENKQTTLSNDKRQTVSDREVQDYEMEDPNVRDGDHRLPKHPLAPSSQADHCLPSPQTLPPENPSRYPGSKYREGSHLDAQDFKMEDHVGYRSHEKPPPTPRLASRLPPSFSRGNEIHDRQELREDYNGRKYRDEEWGSAHYRRADTPRPDGDMHGRQSQEGDADYYPRGSRIPSTQPFPAGNRYSPMYASDEYYDCDYAPNAGRNTPGWYESEGREQGGPRRPQDAYYSRDGERRERGRGAQFQDGLYHPRLPQNTPYGFYSQANFYDPPRQRQGGFLGRRARRNPSAEGLPHQRQGNSSDYSRGRQDLENEDPPGQQQEARRQLDTPHQHEGNLSGSRAHRNVDVDGPPRQHQGDPSGSGARRDLNADEV